MLTKTPRRIRLRRRFAVLWILLLVLGGFALNGYLAFRPQALSDRLKEVLDEQLLCGYRIGDLDVSYARGIELIGFELTEPGHQQRPIASFRNLRVVPRLWSLVSGQFEASAIVVDGFTLSVREAPDGSWNLSDILRKSDSPKSKNALAQILKFLRRLPRGQIEDAKIEYFGPDGRAGPAYHLSQLQVSVSSAGSAAEDLCTVTAEAAMNLGRRVAL
ncbi:MAG: hypothetical protein AAF488_11950, partial [Planctomycetota bacterium]